MPVSGSAQFAATLPKYIEEARLILSQIGVMKQAILEIPLKKESGLTLNIPTWTQPTAYTLTEGVVMAQAQQISDSNVAITVAENAGVQVILTKLALGSMRENMMRMAARSMANAVENKRDDDLLTLLGGFSTVLGTAGTSLAIGHIMAGKARLLNSTRPLEAPIQGVFHLFQLHALYEDLLSLVGGSFGNVSPPSGGIQDDILRNYDVFDVAGVRIWADPLIVADASDDGKGGLYAKNALIYVPYEDEEIEDEYDSNLRGWTVNAVATYGYGEYLDAWGFQMLFDQAAPTQ